MRPLEASQTTTPLPLPVRKPLKLRKGFVDGHTSVENLLLLSDLTQQKLLVFLALRAYDFAKDGRGFGKRPRSLASSHASAGRRSGEPVPC